MIVQKRPYELDEYIQRPVGDPDYIDPASLYIAVDKNGLTEPLRFSLVDILTSAHIENGVETPSSTSYSLTYNSEFGTSSYYLNVNVYKLETYGSKTIRVSHPYYNFTKTISGFSMTLEDYGAETLYIEYLAFESTLITSISGLQSALDLKVDISGNQDINDEKNFTTGIKINSSALISAIATGLANNGTITTQGYVDDRVQEYAAIKITASSGSLSSNYNRFIFENTSNGAYTLPEITDYRVGDKIYCYVQNASDNDVTLTPKSGQTINNFTSAQRDIFMNFSGYSCVLEVESTTNWNIVTTFGGTFN